MNIGGGARFRILGGGAKGGGKLFGGCKLIEAPAPNTRQIFTFLTQKTDNIAKLRIELKSTLLEIPSNKINGTYIIKLVHLRASFTVSHGHRQKMWVDYGVVVQRVCCPPPPSKIIGGCPLPPPLPKPMNRKATQH